MASFQFLGFFLHSLYRQCLSQRVEEGRRAHSHRRLGTAKEVVFREQARDHAVELAEHFEAGWEYQRPVGYYYQAAVHAIHFSAPHEAVLLCRRALALLATLPETAERLHHDLALQTTLGLALTITQGPAAQEVAQSYRRAWELRHRVSTPIQDFSILHGLWGFHTHSGEFKMAEEFARQCVQEAAHLQDPSLAVAAHWMLGSALHLHGWSAPARVHLEQSLALSTPEVNAALIPVVGQDVQIFTLSILAHVLARLGYVDQGLERDWKSH